jgi:signal transduction histidine kinase
MCRLITRDLRDRLMARASILAILWFMYVQTPALASHVISNANSLEEVSGIEFLYDAQNELSSDDLFSYQEKGSWLPMLDGRRPNFGDGAYWLRFELTNSLSTQTNFVLSFDRWELIEGYVREGDELLLVGVTGQATPFVQRPACGKKGEKLCFQLEEGKTRQFYIRLRQESKFALPVFFLNIRVGTEGVAESEALFQDNLVFATLAILLFVLIYNFFMYVSTRQHRYRFYLIHMVVVALELCRRGGLLNYLWWDLEAGPVVDNFLYWVLNWAATFLLLPLFLDYLDVDKYLPRWGRRLRLLVIPVLAIGTVSFYSPHLLLEMAAIAMIFYSILFLYVNLLLLRIRHPVAGYFLPAMIIFDIGTTVHAMSEAGFFYLGENWEIIARFVTVIICDVILSYGLGRLIYLLSKENESKRLQLITSLTEQRDAQIRLGKKIINIQERVREDIAAQLHDDVQNLLVSSRFNLMAARPIGADQQGSQVEDLELSINQLKEAIQVVRRISHDLHPASLANPDGLGVSIENFLQWEDRNKHIRLHYEGSPPLPFTIRTLAYRIVQALVTEFNATGEATEADLSILQNEKELKIIAAFQGPVLSQDENTWHERTKGALQVLELFSGSLSLTPDGKGGSFIQIVIPLEWEPIINEGHP